LTLLRGECAAIIGPNGAGKTTLLKTLLEALPPLAGEVLWGASLKIGYFAQAHEDLHPAWTLMQEIQAAGPKMLESEVRDYLARFLFSGDDVFKTVGLLSGGERGRLALACLALQGTNLLLLDEPTNHLDLPSQEMLQTLLSDYPGTILLVSHDRFLIDALATQIWEVFPQQLALRVFAGSYSEYKSTLQNESAAPTEESRPAAAPVERPRSRPAGGNNNQARQRRERLKQVEDEITTLEQRLSTLTRQLERPGDDAGQVAELGRNYTATQQALEQAMEQWAELAEE
jgi:ATP-binding cassette subfamily F protein 3